MATNDNFDDIRAFDNSEVRATVEALAADEHFRKSMSVISGGIPFETIATVMRSCDTVRQFQERVCYPIVTTFIRRCSSGVQLDITSIPNREAPHIYISNHRDIVLDSALLSIKLLEQGLDTVEIAIGDNLLIYPWIRNFVRLNKAFIVKRGLTMRHQLEASMELSQYIHHTIAGKHQSVWIAQREGRAKDSSDETQESVVKMLAMGGGRDIRQSLAGLDIVPLTISYEFDPCDYLKAREMQMKRDDPGYKKEAKDDIQNMSIGISGQKGRINYKTGRPLNTHMQTLDGTAGKPEMFHELTEWLTREIHRNYTLYPCNYVACDMLDGTDTHSAHYTADDRRQFAAYLDGQLAKIDLPAPDMPFLKHCIVNMYANPVINKTKAQCAQH